MFLLFIASGLDGFSTFVWLGNVNVILLDKFVVVLLRDFNVVYSYKLASFGNHQNSTSYQIYPRIGFLSSS